MINKVQEEYNCIYEMLRLSNRMRQLSLTDIRNRREQIFNKSRELLHSQLSDFQSQSSQSSSFQQVPMEEENTNAAKQTQRQKKKKKNEVNHYITERYWRRLFQIQDMMVEVPDNLNQYFVSPLPTGIKCLLYFKLTRGFIRDSTGVQVASFQMNSKCYDGSIVQAYYNTSKKQLVISDLIVWKYTPMSTNDLEFRLAWIQSNMYVKKLQQMTNLNIYHLNYAISNPSNIQLAYKSKSLFQKMGLMFIHKDSIYLHGYNPNVLYWYDGHINPRYGDIVIQNLISSTGIGYIQQNGEVKSQQNITLFVIDRSTIQKNHRFVEFNYKDLIVPEQITNKVQVFIKDLYILKTFAHYNHSVDTLGKLIFRSRLNKNNPFIQQIIAASKNNNPTLIMNLQQ